jgi:hypothetical protein
MARVMPTNHSPAVVMRAPRSMSLAVRDRERGEEGRGKGGLKMASGDRTGTKKSGGERGVESKGGGGLAVL